MPDMLSSVLQRIRRFQKRFGYARGLLLWLRLRQHVRKQEGALHVVRVPGLNHPVALRAKTSDVGVFHQVFVDGELEFNLNLSPSRIIDAGANIGLASLYLASRFPEAKILALEIEEANFELLRRNTASYPNITCLRKALWSGTANLTIANPTAEPWSFRVSRSTKEDEEGLSAVGVKDLVEMFEGRRVDLLKIDIEGAEKEVFEHGMDQWIDQVDTIAVELHDRFEPGCSKALVDSLRDRVYRLYTLGEYTVVELGGTAAALTGVAQQLG
jgi:FkbM family methyltransferase